MSSYKILNPQLKNSKKLNVKIKTSTNPKKKVDIFKNNKKVASIGDVKYGDYHTYIKSKGKTFAVKRQDAYKKRHAKTLYKKGTASYYADKILWS
tara:strand:+ start:72 stop:356 length:285 start_codon:yes stop_codon:yes gene_type:complete